MSRTPIRWDVGRRYWLWGDVWLWLHEIAGENEFYLAPWGMLSSESNPYKDNFVKYTRLPMFLGPEIQLSPDRLERAYLFVKSETGEALLSRSEPYQQPSRKSKRSADHPAQRIDTARLWVPPNEELLVAGSGYLRDLHRRNTIAGEWVDLMKHLRLKRLTTKGLE